jgi:hypothetical protein
LLAFRRNTTRDVRFARAGAGRTLPIARSTANAAFAIPRTHPHGALAIARADAHWPFPITNARAAASFIGVDELKRAKEEGRGESPGKARDWEVLKEHQCDGTKVEIGESRAP